MLFSFNNICFTMGKDTLRHVCASGAVEGNGTLVIRGPSGSGKTTLLRTLARLRPAEKGEVFFQDKSWKEFSGTHWRRRIHYLAQRPVLFQGTVAVNMAKPFELGIISREKQFDSKKAKMILSRLLLPDDIWDQNAAALSGGEISRIALARALMTDPCVLLLDEPTAALDNDAAKALYSLLAQWLRKPGKACILVSHIEDYLDLNPSYLDLAVKEEEI